MNVHLDFSKLRWLAFALVSGALLAATACGSSAAEVVVQTVVVDRVVDRVVPGDTVIQTVVVDRVVPGDTVIQTVVVDREVAGETVIQTVVVDREVAGETVVQTVVVDREVTVVVTAVPKAGAGGGGAPVQQGTLKVALGSVGSPVFTNQDAVFPTNMLQYLFGIQETLLTGDSSSCVVPLLATGWELSNDLSKVTFAIRDGVHFYTDDRDWGEMTAADIVFSYNEAGADNAASRHSAAGELNSTFLPWVVNPNNPAKVDAPFKQFRGDFLEYNTVSACNDSAAVVSKALFEELGADETLLTPHGTGPFIVTDWKSNEKITMRANQDYWGTAPGVSILELIETPEGSVRTAQLKTGEVDIAAVPIGDVPSLQGDGFEFNDGLRQFLGHFIYFAGNYNLDYIPENDEPVERTVSADAEHPWIGDPNDAARSESARKVRHAMSMAIDRDLINDTILAEYGGPIYGGGVSVTIHQNHPEWKSRWEIAFDPDGAKALLAEAGYPDGFAVPDFFCPTSIGVNVEVCQAVAGMWQDNLGLDVGIDTSAYTARRPTMVGRTINVPWIAPWGPNRLSYSGEIGGTIGCCSFPQPTGGYNPGIEDLRFWDTFQETAPQLQGSPENLASREAYFDWGFENMLSTGVVEVPTLIGVNPERVVTWNLLPFRDMNNFQSVFLAAP